MLPFGRIWYIYNLHYEKFADGTEKCIEDEIPFDLPPSWSWCRLGVLFAHNTGKALNSSDTTGTRLTYITTSNLYWDRFELDSLKEMPFTGSEIEKCTVRKGDLLVCEGGDIGRSAIWLFDDEIRIQNHIHRLRTYIELSNRFYYYVMYLWKRMERIGGQGIGLQGFSSKALHKLIVPLPPVNEQFSVVEKLDSILGSVDALDELNAEFTVDVECIKKQILDLAIRGKLVPQNPDDEPASVLLERIRTEKEELIKAGKIKRDKKESVVFKGEDNSYYEKFDNGEVKRLDDELPFDIPESWRWCRLKDLFNVCSAKRVLQSEWKKEGIPFYRAREIVKLSNEGYVDNDLYISLDHFERLQNNYGVPQAGDLMVTGVGTIGKVYIVKSQDVFYYKDASVLCFENCFQSMIPEFAKMLMESTLLQTQIHSQTYGNTVDTITISTANDYLCVLPPLNQQQRIVEFVEKIYTFIESIEKSLA